MTAKITSCFLFFEAVFAPELLKPDASKNLEKQCSEFQRLRAADGGTAAMPRPRPTTPGRDRPPGAPRGLRAATLRGVGACGPGPSRWEMLRRGHAAVKEQKEAKGFFFFLLLLLLCIFFAR